MALKKATNVATKIENPVKSLFEINADDKLQLSLVQHQNLVVEPSPLVKLSPCVIVASHVNELHAFPVTIVTP